MTGIFQLIRVFLAGYMVIQIPGVPVNIISFHSGFAVACTVPGCVYLFTDRESPGRISLEVDDPVDLISWNGLLTVSDRHEHRESAWRGKQFSV